MYLYLYNGDLLGALPNPNEIRVEDLEDDNDETLDEIDKGRCIQ